MTAVPAVAPAASGPFGRGTLARALVLRTTALVAVVALLLSGFTAVAMHRILEAQLDQQLLSTAGRFPTARDSVPRVGAGGPGQAQGLLIYEQGSGGFVQVERDREVLADQVTAVLEALQPSREPVTQVLPGLGTYRLVVTSSGSHTFITGLPTAGVTASMNALLLAAGLLTVLAIALAFLAARKVVEQSLLPLKRLATTANQVSALELRSGEVAVPVRVPAADTDPRSEVGQVGLAFNHMLDNVEDALAARQRSETKVRQFVADASHELRNPLASIRGYAEFTRRQRADLPDDTRHALGRIESESERMSHLVEDLLLLARLDSGPNLNREPVDLTDVVVNAVSDAQVAGPDHHWSVALPDAAEVVVLGDRFRLHQVLANLLANARTHTPPGSHITTTLAVVGRDAVVSVLDDGPGVPEELRERVFERFTRADAARARSGQGTSSTGLGLAIVRAVVEAHGGAVSVRSGERGGSEFTVQLPLANRGTMDVNPAPAKERHA